MADSTLRSVKEIREQFAVLVDEAIHRPLSVWERGLLAGLSWMLRIVALAPSDLRSETRQGKDW